MPVADLADPGAEAFAEAVAVSGRPAPPLRAHVEGYLGYRLSGFAAGVHRGLPSRNLTFIVSIGPAIDVIAQTDPRQAPAAYRAVVSGLQATPALIAHSGHQEGVGIQLTPLGARALLGVTAGAITNQSIELADVIGPAGDELWERLQGTTGWSERFRVCDDVLVRHLRRDAATPAPLAHAWRSIVGSGGVATVAEVARELGWSRQHLTRRFGAEFGLGPKVAARVVRFERACGLLRAGPRTPIGSVAAECGFYDQAHLDREFAELAGCSPSEWVATEVLVHPEVSVHPEVPSVLDAP